MIVGVISLTGVGLKFSTLVMALSGGLLPVALVQTMLTCLVPGMGLPTAAAYILVATLVAPALVEMGAGLIGADLFVLYSALLSSITPPVALAAYAAASIAGANPLKIALVACQFAIAGGVCVSGAIIGHRFGRLHPVARLAPALPACTAAAGPASRAARRAGLRPERHGGGQPRLRWRADPGAGWLGAALAVPEADAAVRRRIRDGLVEIPGGFFDYGARRSTRPADLDASRLRVTLRPFLIAPVTVTNEAFAAFVASIG